MNEKSPVRTMADQRDLARRVLLDPEAATGFDRQRFHHFLAGACRIFNEEPREVFPLLVRIASRLQEVGRTDRSQQLLARLVGSDPDRFQELLFSGHVDPEQFALPACPGMSQPWRIARVAHRTRELLETHSDRLSSETIDSTTRRTARAADQGMGWTVVLSIPLTGAGLEEADRALLEEYRTLLDEAELCARTRSSLCRQLANDLRGRYSIRLL